MISATPEHRSWPDGERVVDQLEVVEAAWHQNPRPSAGRFLSIDVKR
jgi:hypothetical protein